jgi:hypothetical protein
MKSEHHNNNGKVMILGGLNAYLPPPAYNIREKKLVILENREYCTFIWGRENGVLES